MKKVFGITGHKGNLGSHFVKLNKDIKFVPFKGDITKKREIKKWLYKTDFDCIIHFAAKVPTSYVKSNFYKANNVNYLSTKNLVDLILKLKKKPSWFFFSSTSHVYKTSKKKLHENSYLHPSSLYGLTKFRAENYIKKKFTGSKIKFCIGRIFSFTSRKQKKNYLIPNLKSKIKSKKKIILFKNLNHYRDFLSILDICNAIRHLYQKRFVGIINIASGKKIFLKSIANILCKKKGKTPKFIDNTNPSIIVANIQKLKKTGWRPKYIKNKNIFDL